MDTMGAEQLTALVIETIAGQFDELLRGEITAATTLRADLHFDSTACVELAMELEDSLSTDDRRIELPEAEMAPVVTVAELVALCQRKLTAGPATQP